MRKLNTNLYFAINRLNSSLSKDNISQFFCLSNFYLLFIFFITFFNYSYGQVTQEWVQRYDGSANLEDVAYSIAVDGSGNVYVTGTSFDYLTYFATYNFATIKYNSSGVQQWVQGFTGSAILSADGGNSIAVDGSGNVYVAGVSEGSSTGFDYTIIKYNSSGVQQWVQYYNGPGNSDDNASSMVIDGSGNVYITGSSVGIGTSSDYATIKYNSSGVQQWIQRYNGLGNLDDGANSITIDDSGNVYVTGSSSGAGTSWDYATIKYNSSGVQQWVQRYNGSGNLYDGANSITLDGSGNVYVTGGSSGIGTSRDYATIKYNSSGVQQWVQRYNGPANSLETAGTIAIDGSGNVYVIGTAYVNIDSTSATTIKYNSSGVQQWVQSYISSLSNGNFEKRNSLVIDSAGNVYIIAAKIGINNLDIATIKYNPTGVQQWIEVYNGPDNSDDYPTAIKIDNLGNLYVTGASISNSGKGSFDYVTIKYKNQYVPIIQPIQPSISISPIQINPGGSVSINGQNFRANAQVKVSVISSNSENVLDQTIPTNSNGGFIINYSSNANSTPGIYTVSCRDILTNQSAPNRIFEVNEQPETFDLDIIFPVAHYPVTDSVDLNFYIQWEDKMLRGSGYNITGSKRHYKYLITFSTDGGFSWKPDSIYLEGDAQINSTPLFKKKLNLESIFERENNISVNFRVTDLINTNRKSTSGAIPVRLNKLTKSTLSTVWDYCYPERTGEVIGACADGVSRFFIKVDKIPGPYLITSVELELSDQIGSSTNKILGKIMEAEATDSYSDEAKDATSTNLTINGDQNQYWFWYVSPDDFVRNDADKDIKLREVRAKIIVNYSSGPPESEVRIISIIRPPLVLVHGFSGKPDMWEKYDNYLSKLFRFTYTPSIKSQLGFEENGQFLLNQNQKLNFEDKNSLPGIVADVRSQGYASNQVYYVSHSMGGCILRSASELNYYYSRFNYLKGFVNKFITLDTPHFGSPIADFLINIYNLAHLPLVENKLNEFIEKNLNNPLFGSGFTMNDNNTISLTKSFRDLQASRDSIYNFKQTNIRSFLIAGDFLPGSSNLNNLDWNFSYSYSFNTLLSSIDYWLPITTIPGISGFFYKPTDIVSKVIPLTISPPKRKVERVLKHTSLIFDKFLNTENFLQSSDLIVSLNSQLAGFDSELSFNTFDKYEPNNPYSMGIGHAVFNECYKADDVLNKITELLNLPTSSNQFLQFIPATSNSSFPTASINKHVPSFISGRSSSLDILTPQQGQSFFVDSILNISFSLSDTTNLKYVCVTFQGENYYDSLKSPVYNFGVKVSGYEMDTCFINAFAIYFNNDSVCYSNDSRKIYVKSNTFPIDLSISNYVYLMNKNDVVQPQYKIVFPNFIHNGIIQDISATIENPSVISFNNTEKSFKAISSGETSAIISIGNANDTIYFNVITDIQLPGNVVLYFPSDSAIVSSSNIKFNWNIVDNASYYNFQIAKDINFESIIFENDDLSDTTVTVPSVEDSIIYYWRVRGLNSAGSGDWSQVHNFTALPIRKSYLFITILTQGLYNESTNTLSRSDTVKAYLKNTVPPFNTIDSSLSIINPVTFEGSFEFNYAPSGIYMIKVNHMNSIETWSKAGGESFTNDSKNYYNFSCSISQAYGNNQILIGSKYCIYSGDVNQDGLIDLTDVLLISNDASIFSAGYLVTDLNGDNLTDLTDLLMGFNNSSLFITKITP